MVDIDEEGLEKVRGEIEGLGVGCLAERVDVSDRRRREGLAVRAISWKHRVDILVNNAGVTVWEGSWTSSLRRTSTGSWASTCWA